LEYDKRICSADMPIGFNGQDKHGAPIVVTVTSPDGDVTICDSIAKASKIMGKDASYTATMLRATGVYVFKDGWQIRISG
jgi:hypothetical protein